MDIQPLIDIPEVKPAIEQIRGAWYRKMSPKHRHSLAQFRMATVLTEWAGDRGEVGTEWRCYFFPSNEPATSLVADVSYFSFERLPLDLGERREQPTIAPDIAVEILSPDDSRKRLREKIGLYFTFGARAVLVVNPAEGTVVSHDTTGEARTYRRGDVPKFGSYPDLDIDLDELFRNLA